MPASAMQCRDLNVRFPGSRGTDSVGAVVDVNFELPAGQITALVGASGCGKTTLLRTLAGLQPPTGGEVILDPPCQPRRGEIAFVFQQPALLPWRTALQNVVLPLRFLKRESDKTDAVEVAGDWLSAVELSHAADRYPDQLSGGMQMRVSIARALVTRPRVLLLDEPFGALDDLLRGQMGELLLELWERTSFTAVMVTHNIAEAILLSHQVIVMRQGRCMPAIDNPLPWPRNDDQRRTPEFGDFYGVISDRLRAASATPA